MATKKTTPVAEPLETVPERPWERDYLTIDDWVDKFSVSLKCYLKEAVWPGSAEELHHPEDLAANSGAFLDAAIYLLPAFGVHNK